MTHNDKVLALLSDGEPHSHHELYGLFVIAHSRVSDLRKRGHTIEMWREGDDYMYRLLSEGPQNIPSSAPFAEQALPGGPTRSSPPLRRGSDTEPDAVDAHPLASSGQLFECADFYVRNYGEPRAA